MVTQIWPVSRLLTLLRWLLGLWRRVKQWSEHFRQCWPGPRGRPASPATRAGALSQPQLAKQAHRFVHQLAKAGPGVTLYATGGLAFGDEGQPRWRGALSRQGRSLAVADGQGAAVPFRVEDISEVRVYPERGEIALTLRPPAAAPDGAGPPTLRVYLGLGLVSGLALGGGWWLLKNRQTVLDRLLALEGPGRRACKIGLCLAGTGLLRRLRARFSPKKANEPTTGRRALPVRRDRLGPPAEAVAPASRNQ